MLSVEQRRKQLETVLERIGRNRSRLGPARQAPPADAETVRPLTVEMSSLAEPRKISEVSVAAAQPAVEVSHGKPDEAHAPPAEISPTDTIREPIRELAAAAARLPAEIEPPGPDVESVEVIIDVEEELAPAVVDLGESDVVPTPTMAGPDEEPEIEVSYGTLEALALQAEPGLGGDELAALAARRDSSIALAAIDQAAGAVPAALDDLPAPAPPEPAPELPVAAAAVTEPAIALPVTEPTPISLEPTATPTIPVTGAKIPEMPAPPPPSEATTRRLRAGAKTIVDFLPPPEMPTAPVPAEVPEPARTPEPSQEAAPREVARVEEREKPTDVATLEMLGTPSTMELPLDAPVTEALDAETPPGGLLELDALELEPPGVEPALEPPGVEPAVDELSSPDARVELAPPPGDGEEEVLELDTAEVVVPEVVRPRTAEPAAAPPSLAEPETAPPRLAEPAAVAPVREEPTPLDHVTYSVEEIRTLGDPAELIGMVEPPRAATLGDVLRRALSVGKK
jgi:nicotinate-nucleotide--dimethylbenzimidazole phosphoribosyltransferase